MVSSADLSEVDGIVTVGGDGLLYEVVNGLRCRADTRRYSDVCTNTKQAYSINVFHVFPFLGPIGKSQRLLVFTQIPVGVIAGGSGNGLARSIAAYSGESEDYLRSPVLETTLAVAGGKVMPVNLVSLQIWFPSLGKGIILFDLVENFDIGIGDMQYHKKQVSNGTQVDRALG
jgi:hypothetical protein